MFPKQIGVRIKFNFTQIVFKCFGISTKKQIFFQPRRAKYSKRINVINKDCFNLFVFLINKVSNSSEAVVIISEKQLRECILQDSEKEWKTIEKEQQAKENERYLL